jgi:succinate dehydrogenase/fumarate reductase flavoprotein subunit
LTSRTCRASKSRKKLLGILEVYIKFVGDDPRETPMRIYPAQHYSMGGLWVGLRRETATASWSLSTRATR